MLRYQFSLECNWLQPYIPHSLTHAAIILADHIDFWEEEAFRSTEGLYRPRELTDFIQSGCAADKRLKPRFKELLEEYIDLATSSSGNIRPRPGDQPFQITRRHNVQIAIADVRMWLDSQGYFHEFPAVGQKRPRES
jgi:hypothetical protein